MLQNYCCYHERCKLKTVAFLFGYSRKYLNTELKSLAQVSTKKNDKKVMFMVFFSPPNVRVFARVGENHLVIRTL